MRATLLAGLVLPGVPAFAADVAATASAADSPVEDSIIVTGERTERSDDFTVAAQTSTFRFPLSLKETPESISVVTRAQIRAFQLNDVDQLLSTVPGVNVQRAETDRVYYSARGFDIQTFQVDGIGLPFAFEVSTGTNDTAIYDHVEVVRGAPGLLSSTGNPSAVVNFIRKRPTSTFQASAAGQYGSFDSGRLDADVSTPLNRSGTIRARAVGAYVDQDSYLDRYHLRRWTGYGTIEADIGPDTTVNLGYSYQNHKTHGAMWGAIPLYYTDGTRIDLPRSANTGPDWAGWNVIDRQIYGDLIHKFGGDGDWTLRVTAIRRAINENDALFYVYGNPNRQTGLGVLSYPGAFRAVTRNLTLDANLAGKVHLFGRDHDLMVGVNRSAQQYDQYSSYDQSAINVSLPLAQVYDGSFPRPNFPAAYDHSLYRNTRRETGYGMVRLNLADPLKLMAGVNVTHAYSSGMSYGAPTNYSDTRGLPFVGATYNITPHVTAYASYATIFNPQVETTRNRQLVGPIKGNNLEAGIKGAWFGDRLNASAAIFQVRQDNTAQSAGFDTTIGQTVYEGVDAKSQGIELEVGGRIAAGLQATGGYTLMRIRNVGAGGPARTFVPRQTGRLNLIYNPPALPALKLGVSAQYQTKIYNEPGTLSVTTQQPIRVEQGRYALVDLLVGYDVFRNVSLALNVRNVTDKKYLNALNYDQGFYGAPRSFLGTISFRY